MKKELLVKGIKLESLAYIIKELVSIIENRTFEVEKNINVKKLIFNKKINDESFIIYDSDKINNINDTFNRIMDLYYHSITLEYKDNSREKRESDSVYVKNEDSLYYNSYDGVTFYINFSKYKYVADFISKLLVVAHNLDHKIEEYEIYDVMNEFILERDSIKTTEEPKINVYKKDNM